MVFIVGVIINVYLVMGFMRVVYIVIFEFVLWVGRFSVICDRVFDLYIK